MEAINLVNKAIGVCNFCPDNCNKKGIVGSGDTLYIIPYDSDDEEILSHRGVVMREVACQNGIDYYCNIYVRSLVTLFSKIVCPTDYASKLVGRKIENFEKFRFRSATIVAADAPCDIRVRQELGEK